MSRTWRIGEVAEHTGLTRRTLRHYDELGLLVPSGRSGADYRLYDEADLLRLLQIQTLKALGLGLPEVADALADPSLDASATLRTHLDHLEERIAAERRLADRLRTLAETAERSWDDVVTTIALVQQLAHPDPVVRLRAAFRSPGSTAEQLDALAVESDPAVQEVLVWSLARKPDAAPAALARLGTAEAAFRVPLVRLLGKLRAPSAAPALAAALDDPEPTVVAAAVQALGQLGDPAPAPALVALLGTGRAPVADLVEALAALGEPALPALATALGSGSAEVRSTAAETIGRLRGTPRAEFGSRSAALLRPLLTDPDAEVRLAALLALREHGQVDGPVIELALADPGLAPVARRLTFT